MFITQTLCIVNCYKLGILIQRLNKKLTNLIRKKN